MKILYAIQGTGNGHLSRARDIIPILQQKGNLDILVSGIQADVDLPYELAYRFNGLSFIFGKKGGVDLFKTYQKSSLRNLYKEIQSLRVENYDLVLNDFEPVSAWACKWKNKTCIGLSHQAAVINKKSPKPASYDFIGQTILHQYAPVTTAYGFHFDLYDDNIYHPVIRKPIREADPSDQGFYTVYLPAYGDEKIIEVLSKIPEVEWRVFSKHSKIAYQQQNVSIQPINNELFIDHLINCRGILCGAGFETPAEALYLKKKLLVIPMTGQYEQQCNAAALAEMGVPVIPRLENKYVDTILHWIKNLNSVHTNYTNNTESIIDMIIEKHVGI